MRRLSSLPLALLLLGVGCLPDAHEAAVRVEVTYTFKAGCITVLARDAESPEREASQSLLVFDREPSTVRLAVFREKDWSHTLEVTTLAHERSCDGPVVAREVRTLELREARVETLAVTLEATDTDKDGYVPIENDGTDCNDDALDTHPGASELCDDLDNDCDGVADEEVKPSWYPDQDGDDFGDRNAAPVMSCTAPAGPTAYVKDGSDCQDSDATIFPQASPETRCDDLDDNCDGVVDDGFALKGTGCEDPCPGGEWVCNASRNGLACANSPSQVDIYPDVDGDGAGDQDAPSSGSVCPNALPPATAANKDDCDDLDPYNRRGQGEICDGRDNTCNTSADEGNVCEGKGWKQVADAALTGSRQWKTVALGAGGFPVWVAGTGGTLAVRPSADQPFKSLDGACGTHNWLSAWVNPLDGVVYLGAEGGQLAQHDGTTCSNQTDNASNFPITGLIGFPSQGTLMLYVVNDRGRLSTWTPGSPPEQQFNLDPQTYHGIHGLEPSRLLGVGGTEETFSKPHVASYPGTGATVEHHTLQDVPGTYDGSLRAVWMAGPGLAYAAGDNGLVMQWDGQTTWSRVQPPSGATSADFTSLVVLDPSSVYVTDTGGVIRRRDARGWASSALHSGDRPLRDIAASSTTNLWAVGDDGRVLHFPE